MGGLSKKAYQLERLRKNHQDPILLLDAGSLLFSHEKMAPVKAKQDKITAEAIVEAYKFMGYQAVGIGNLDLSGGLTFLDEMRKRSKFAWVSANLVDEITGKPLFTDRVILPLGDLKVAVLGVTDPKASRRLAKEAGAAIIDWPKVLPDLANKAAVDADLVILLSGYPREANKQIAASVPQINLIIQSGRRSSAVGPQLVGNTLITQAGQKGKYQGIMDISWNPSFPWRQSSASLLADKQIDLQKVGKRLASLKLRMRQNPKLANNQSLKKSYEALQKRQSQLSDEIATLHPEIKKEKKGQAAVSTFHDHSMALEKKLPDQPEVLALVEGAKEKLNQLIINSRKKQVSTLPYVGWIACARCHRQQSGAWQQTGHAMAMHSLANQGQTNNLSCVPCHVTGVVSGNEPYLTNLPGQLQHVSCEACHGPGQSHVADPAKFHLVAKPGEEVCRRCHSPEQDPEFSYSAKLKLIKCPAAGPAEK